MNRQLDNILKRSEHPASDYTPEEKPPEFPAPFSLQLTELVRRAYQNYFRSVIYLSSKLLINIFAGKFDP
jgi:hypothetical protein